MYGNNAQGGGGNFAAGMTAAERAQQPGRGRISRATRVNPDEANSQRPQRRGGRLLAVAALVGVLTLAGGAAAWLNRDGGNAQGAAPQRPQNGQVAAVDQAALRQWGINGTVGMPDDLETKQAMDAQKAHSAIMGGKLEETELSQAVNAELQLPEGSNIWREIAIQLRDKDVFDTLTLDQKEDIAAGLSNHAQDISGISDVEVRRMAIGAKYQGVDLNNPIIQARLIATADMTPEQKDNLGMLRPRSSDENVRATQSENLIKYLLTGQLPDTGNSNRRAAMRGSFGH